MENEIGPNQTEDFGDANKLTGILVQKLSSASSKPKEGIQATIFRVPENIRKTNVDSFEPKMVSLGPYHYGNPRFRATDERIKLPYASNFFKSTTSMDANVVQSIVELFKDWESDLRCAYSEQISMSSDKFVEMMLLDCAFMAEFLREQAGRHGTGMEEYSWKRAAPSIINDMLVVENQFPLLPLFYLLDVREDTRTWFFPSLFLTSSLTASLCRDLTEKIHGSLSPNSTLTSNFSSFQTSAHLLHLFHSRLVSELRKKASCLRTDDLSSFPSAETLQAMRIQFAKKTDGSSFLDITFDESKRSMEIPQLVINDDNISLLRNLIAFEQQCHGVGYYISTYVWFMDCLINTDKDVAVLRKHNIIYSRLRSDEEVARIFNELRRTDVPVVDFDNFYLAEVMNNVKRYCRKKTNRLCALWNFSWLRQNYFKNRWVTIGVTAVVFFNLLTLVQTVYAILSYAKQ